ncbi:MAG TPA: hypothetical protein VGS98_02230 [Thermoanaerobaculia bacterium]|nr:hypothetical protein [Thermoanaerobaculia bacterium]
MAVRWRALLSEIRNGWPAGLFIGGLLVASMIGWLIWWRVRPVTAADSIRYAGTLLELFGLVLVAIGLSDVRRLFGRLSILVKIQGSLSRAGAAIRSHPITGSGAVAIGGAQVSARGRTFHRAREGASPEERVSMLEKGLDSALEELDRAVQRVENQFAATRESIQHESRERAADNQRVSQKIEEFAVGGLHLEIVGLSWLILGMIATNLAGEIARILVSE